MARVQITVRNVEQEYWDHLRREAEIHDRSVGGLLNDILFSWWSHHDCDSELKADAAEVLKHNRKQPPQ